MLTGPAAFFFQMAKDFRSVSSYNLSPGTCFWLLVNVPIIQHCLELYTVLGLMRIGWHFAGTERLEMSEVKDTSSPWYGITPVPRMLQNQLNHQLELKMVELDEKIMKTAMVIMKKADRKQWLVGMLSIFLLLHVREIDAGRNLFWNRYEDKDGFWIHPSKPRALIAEAVTSANSLITHAHCTIGRKPLETNWDSAKSKALVDNDTKLIDAMKALQLHVIALGMS
ncbi:hypothetical protein DH86_00000224 [Scytalidium sp. 3C]|nr:hypothetical protein DH86_00000224 [Scytalidium sp. 3C]